MLRYYFGFFHKGLTDFGGGSELEVLVVDSGLVRVWFPRKGEVRLRERAGVGRQVAGD
jgi:hypothetical protein